MSWKTPRHIICLGLTRLDLASPTSLDWTPFDCLWLPLGSVFPANLGPKIHENPRKIDAKMPSHLHFIFTSIFDGFLLPTWTPQTSVGASGLAPIGFFVFSENPMLDPILVPTWLHFPSQHPQKSFQRPIPRCINFLTDFWMDFFINFSANLGLNLEPCLSLIHI